MEEFIGNGYFKVQQKLANSQKEIEELLGPVTGFLQKSEGSQGLKENIDAVSRNMRNSLLDLQKMHNQQSVILKHFKELTGNFQKYSKVTETCEVGCQTDVKIKDLDLCLESNGKSVDSVKVMEELSKDFCEFYFIYKSFSERLQIQTL